MEYVNATPALFTGKQPESLDDWPLLVPISSFGKAIDRIQLHVPSMKATKVMSAEKDPIKAVDFISSHCTGIPPTDIGKLSLPDWNQLQGRLDDFLNKPAAFFQSATSK
nr:phage tail assembly protein [Pseudomonas aeruginosa]